MYLEMDDYDEYSSQPTPVNQAKIATLAAEVASSWLLGNPVVTVNVIGHADQALRVPPGERQQKEMEVSVNRASAAVELIKSSIRALPGGADVVERIQFLSSGIGSRQRKVLNPVTDAQRRKNRRVEITTIPSDGGIIHVLPEWPGREPTPVEPALDKVFAVKLMEGVSGGPLFQYTFAIWDKQEQRAGLFDYRGLGHSTGASSPFASESDWAEVLFPVGTTLEKLDGAASHSVATLPFSLMVLHIPQGSVVIPLGIAMGIALENGTGLFTLSPTSIKPFDGN